MHTFPVRRIPMAYLMPLERTCFLKLVPPPPRRTTSVRGPQLIVLSECFQMVGKNSFWSEVQIILFGPCLEGLSVLFIDATRMLTFVDPMQ